MSNKEDKLFIDIVSRFAEESKCCKLKVASLAVRDRSPLCIGINGTAPGTENCEDHFKAQFDLENMIYHSESFLEEHHKWSYIHELHAEQNLIARCLKQNISLENSTIYQTHFTCPECARLLSRTGIKELVYVYDYDRQNNDSLEILQSQNIIVRQYN